MSELKGAEQSAEIVGSKEKVAPLSWAPSVGAIGGSEGTLFRCWAPEKEVVEVVLERAGILHSYAALPEGGGWFSLLLPGVEAGARYWYRVDDKNIPDPFSRYQPEGVHGPSEVVDPDAFEWTDSEWSGLQPERSVIYEVHVGAATSEGTFDSLREHLDDLVDLGITAIELMPVAQFSGSRNWGYDGVYWFAPAETYGGPDGLRRLVNEAHRKGLGVILDVVYNHLGPEGNYLPTMCGDRLFSDRHQTSWGAAINYDGEGSEAVREIVIENALHWVHEYHIDGLRLDATHAIIDTSRVHILAELAERVRASTNLPIKLIAEDERNDRRVVTAARNGGLGLDAVWADDFHHQIRRCAAGDYEGYFSAYSGTIEDIAETLRKGWFYEGEDYPPTGEVRGTPTDGIEPIAFVHCIQNHDQVGNRAFGERLNHQVDLGVYRAASALLLLSPYTPLLWMGQEWAASSPFLYFTDHPTELGRQVSDGRRSEFRHFSFFSDPDLRDRIPDPQAEETFLRSKLKWDESRVPPHRGIRELYKALLALRSSDTALRSRSRDAFSVVAIGQRTLAMRRNSSADGSEMLLITNFGEELAVDLSSRVETRPPAKGPWKVSLATEDEQFGGTGWWGSYTEDSDSLTMRTAGAVILRA